MESVDVCTFRPHPAHEEPSSFWLASVFTNLHYLVHMPLGFFAFSSPDEIVTLSLVFLAQYYPNEISIFDAKPPIFEAVTLYLSQLFFCKRSSDRTLTPHT